MLRPGMAERRRLLQVRVTDEARAGLDRICNRRNITVTAFLEALGRLAPPAPEDVVELARRIDQERRSRR